MSNPIIITKIPTHQGGYINYHTIQSKLQTKSRVILWVPLQNKVQFSINCFVSLYSIKKTLRGTSRNHVKRFESLSGTANHSVNQQLPPNP